MKKIFVILFTLMMIINPINVFAENDRIVDNAHVLSDSSIAVLTSDLDSLSSKYNYDIVVYLSNDTSFGEDIVSEGCEFFDNNGYGYGEDHDGILLIVNYETGYFDIITTGDDVRNKYDGYIEDCFDSIQGYLRDDPYEAIQIFEYWVDTRFMPEESSDDSYIEPSIPSEDYIEKDNLVRDLSVSGVASLLVSAITAFILKRQLKTEGKRHGATDYINKNSFSLSRSGDIFLYRTTSRRRIVDRSNNTNHHSSGGNGFHISHTSSSGISHGSGGGRRF